MIITGILSLTNACKKIFRTDHLTQRRYKMCTQMCRLTLCMYLLKRIKMSCLLKSNNKNLEILSTYFIFIKTVFFQLDKFFKNQLAPSELSSTQRTNIRTGGQSVHRYGFVHCFDVLFISSVYIGLNSTA